MKFVRLGLAAACWAAMTSTGFAGCLQSDLAGSWELYFASVVPNPYGGANYSFCRMNVDATGAILDSSFCQTFQGRSEVINGTMTMKVPHYCSFQFQFDSPNTVPGYKGLRGTLAKDFSSAAGIMTFPFNSSSKQKPIFMFTMVRL
jgi:hypothetical protein